MSTCLLSLAAQEHSKHTSVEQKGVASFISHQTVSADSLAASSHTWQGFVRRLGCQTTEHIRAQCSKLALSDYVIVFPFCEHVQPRSALLGETSSISTCDAVASSAWILYHMLAEQRQPAMIAVFAELREIPLPSPLDSQDKETSFATQVLIFFILKVLYSSPFVLSQTHYQFL
jgi:hypothetical protein